MSTKVSGDKVLSALKRHLGSVVMLSVLGFIFLGKVGQMRPYDADNLIALSFGKLSASNLLTGSFTSYLPAYRPISKIAVYLQYQLGGVSHLQSFFWINLLVWLGCAVGLYFLLVKITNSALASLVAAIGLLLDPRAIYALIWIGERQNTICLLTGLIALYIAYSSHKVNYKNLILVNLFLILSLLSKEFGLAFVVPIFLVILFKTKSYRLAFYSLFSIAFYLLARFTLGAGSNNAGHFCETMGYFTQTSEVCYSQMGQGAKLKQYFYNSGASFVGTFLPFLFTKAGTLLKLNFTLSFAAYLVFICMTLLFSFWALIKKYKESIVWLLLIILSALANFMLFRERNLLIGMLGFYVLVGIGLSLLFKKIGNKFFSIGIASLAIITIVIFNGLSFKEELADYVFASAKNDPCRSFENYSRDIDKTTIQTVSSYYNLNLNCQNK